jgi:hypothetical protein
MTPSQPDPRSTHIAGRLRAVLQAGSLALVVGLLVPFAASLPLRWRQLSTVVSAADSLGILGPPAMEVLNLSRLGQAEVEALHSLGLSLRFYAAYLLTFEVGLALVCVVVGVFIFWRRSEGWLTLWVALLLVILGTSTVSPEMFALATVSPGWLPVYVVVGMLGMVSHLHLLFLAPDGQFVPRWTLRLAAGFTGGVFVLAGYSVLWARYWGVWASMISLVPVIAIWVVLLGVGTFSQVYRYRHVSSPIQRQQTKWVVLGLAGILAGVLVNGSFFLTASQTSGLARVWVNLARTPLVYLCLLALPICLAFSILRYRLWDIDVLIRRTLIYSVLTGLLALAYFGCVIGLQNVVQTLTGQGQNQLVIVVSTLAIVALSVPLPGRVQALIDRRFYRRKYDAARTLASFAAGARNEVELERLSGRLVDVVQDTMQPAHVSLWLKPSAARVHAPGERLT